MALAAAAAEAVGATAALRSKSRSPSTRACARRAAVGSSSASFDAAHRATDRLKALAARLLTTCQFCALSCFTVNISSVACRRTQSAWFGARRRGEGAVPPVAAGRHAGPGKNSTEAALLSAKKWKQGATSGVVGGGNTHGPAPRCSPSPPRTSGRAGGRLSSSSPRRRGRGPSTSRAVVVQARCRASSPSSARSRPRRRHRCRRRRRRRRRRQAPPPRLRPPGSLPPPRRPAGRGRTSGGRELGLGSERQVDAQQANAWRAGDTRAVARAARSGERHAVSHKPAPAPAPWPRPPSPPPLRPASPPPPPSQPARAPARAGGGG